MAKNTGKSAKTAARKRSRAIAAPVVEWGDDIPVIHFAGRFWFKQDNHWSTKEGDRIDEGGGGSRWGINGIGLIGTSSVVGIIQLFETVGKKRGQMAFFQSRLVGNSEREILQQILQEEEENR